MAANRNRPGNSTPVVGPGPVNPSEPPPQAVLEPLACFKQVEAQARALPKELLIAVNLDIVKMVETVEGSYDELHSLLPEIKQRCPSFDDQHVLQLPTMARALRHAHALYQYALKPQDNLAEVAREAETYRVALRADASTMVVRGWLDPKLLKNVKGRRGYANCASDLLILVNIYRDLWDGIEGRTSVTQRELKRAEELVTIMDRLRGVRAQAPAVVAQAADMRTRMFTLLMLSYNQVRRVVAFVRWDDKDADEFAPNLYAVCRSDKSRPGERDQPESEGKACEPTDASNAQPGAPGASAAAPPAAGAVERGTPGTDGSLN